MLALTVTTMQASMATAAEFAGGPTLASATGALDAWLNLLGRLHPLMVHFPLALVIVAALVELWRAMRRHDGPAPFAVTSVWFAAVGGVGAACSGWANAAFDGDSTSVDLFIHRWGGVAVAALLVALAVTGTAASRAGHIGWSGLWRMGLVLCAGIVAAVGHFGGNLVHGEGYVTRALWTALSASQAADAGPGPGDEGAGTGHDEGARTMGDEDKQDDARDGPSAAPVPTPADAPSPAPSAALASPVSVAYAELLPVFEARCIECHGPRKSKAGIRFDEPAALIGKLREGRVIVKPGAAEASALLRVLTLPVDDELAMPPEGDRLSAEEVAKVRAWIAAGAPLPPSPPN